jgi:hypothetical protein
MSDSFRCSPAAASGPAWSALLDRDPLKWISFAALMNFGSKRESLAAEIRNLLRHIRVTSKHELKERIMAGIDDVNRHPVIHIWSYKLAEAA